MAKNLKINIKNEQLQKALKLGGLKEKLGKKVKDKDEKASQVSKEVAHEELPDEQPRVKARSKSVFAEEKQLKDTPAETSKLDSEESILPESEDVQDQPEEFVFENPNELKEVVDVVPAPLYDDEKSDVSETTDAPVPPLLPKAKELPKPQEVIPSQPKEKLGPTGRHVKDLLPKKKPLPEKPLSPRPDLRNTRSEPRPREPEFIDKATPPPKEKDFSKFETEKESSIKKQPKQGKFKDFKDIKPSKSPQGKGFDSRDRQGLRDGDEEGSGWRRRKPKHSRPVTVEEIVRPTSLKVRLPISIKDLAQEMKIKASQLIEKLFLQGLIVTINTPLDDETTIQLLGHEFGCEIEIDTSQEERIRITDKTITEEINETDPTLLVVRPPIVTFMGHVDHGKTSLIDYIRESNRTSTEAGAINQHIGAFRCHTDVGDIAILDTPGHEAFSAMRARGADVTDIVVLVIAGDEGIRAQTNEAIQHAKAAGVTIVVALNKCDKPNFNAENVYRQLAEIDLLPEAWGGQTITINCSAVTGAGIKELLEMLALQAEVLELKANPKAIARGTVLESQLHKGMGTIATVLVQNGTLNKGDALVFEEYWGRVKTMQDEYGNNLQEAGPSTPVEITGLSGHPEAGQEFIVVKSEKEARLISEVRQQQVKQSRQTQGQKLTIENLFQKAPKQGVKVLNLIVRADVQGSAEALKAGLQKISSEKAELNIILTGVGEISESDVQLAVASKAAIVGFHTQIESHADSMIKQQGVQVYLFDIIYHAIDHVKQLMEGLLDKVAKEVTRGSAKVLTTFKSSQLGTIAGCLVIDGTIMRNYHIRVMRNNSQIWKGTISSLRRMKDDVREVQKDFECGIVLNGFSEYQEDDILEAYEITYTKQEL